MRIQTAMDPSSEDWDAVFDTLLSAPAMARLGEVRVSMLSHGDAPSIRAHLEKRFTIASLETNQPFVEF